MGLMRQPLSDRAGFAGAPCRPDAGKQAKVEPEVDDPAEVEAAESSRELVEPVVADDIHDAAWMPPS